MYEELGEIGQMLVDELKRFGVVARQFDLLPPLGGKVGAFDGLDVEVERARGGVRANSGVSRVGKGTRLFTAETRDVVLVATECLVLGRLQLETTKIGPDDGPHEIV